MKTLVALWLIVIALCVLADSERRFPSPPHTAETAEIVTNWTAFPPSPLNIKQVETAVVRSNVWEINGTNRTMKSSDKIGEIKGAPSNFMAFRVEARTRFVVNQREPILFTNQTRVYHGPRRGNLPPNELVPAKTE